MLSKEKLRSAFVYEGVSCEKYDTYTYIVKSGIEENDIATFIHLLDEGIRVSTINSFEGKGPFVDNVNTNALFYSSTVIPYSELYFRINMETRKSNNNDIKLKIIYYWELARNYDFHTHSDFFLRFRELNLDEKESVFKQSDIAFYNKKFTYSTDNRGYNGHHFTLVEEKDCCCVISDSKEEEESKIEKLERRVTALERELTLLSVSPATNVSVSPYLFHK